MKKQPDIKNSGVYPKEDSFVFKDHLYTIRKNRKFKLRINRRYKKMQALSVFVRKICIKNIKEGDFNVYSRKRLHGGILKFRLEPEQE